MGRPGYRPGGAALRGDGGRTEPAGGEVLDLIAIVVASGKPAAADDPMGFGHRHCKILRLCRQPATAADLASDTGLPLGVVRVLLADLILQGQVTVLRQDTGERARPTC